MSNAFDAGDLLSTRETAGLFGVQPDTLEIWRVQGKGPPFLKLVRTAVQKFTTEVAG
jgi:hypothetical protein